MYEGKNIHYSPFDKKPLCSFSSKVCNQHRLNGYAFCVRHILEDPTAPFRRCSYVAKSSKQTCTQAIPKHEDREYCNNHMQVLGMLPRKEKKYKKDKITENMLSDVKIPFQDRVKSRFNINKLQSDSLLNSKSTDDPDDPYAFPDPSGENVEDKNKIITTVVQPNTPSPAGSSPSSANQNLAKSPGDSNGSSCIAKFYPELAEKLEKIKPKTEIIKLKDMKGKDKSSRTMNSLQTRIAQNRIKSKRRGTQESPSQSLSQSPLGKSPLHPGSISNVYSGFSNHIDFDKHQRTPPAYNHFDSSPTEPQKSANTVPGIELKRPPPNYFKQPLERAQSVTRVDSPVVTSEDKVYKAPTSASTLPVQSVTQSVPMEIPHGTPLQSLPGMPGRTPLSNGPNMSPSLPTNVSNPLSLDLSNPSVLSPSFAALMAKNPFLATLPPHLLASLNQQQVPVPFINLNSTTAGNINPNIIGDKVISPLQMAPQLPNAGLPARPPPPLLSPSGITSTFLSVCGGSTTTTSVTFTAPSQIRPPPPSYSSAVAQQTKTKAPTTASVTSKTTVTKTVLNVIPSVSPSLMSAKPSKMKHVLGDKDVEKKIKTDMARKYYKDYVKRKIYNHSLLKAGVDSCSDDSSDDDKEGFLPWQPKWFCASSDEEGMDEEEDQNDVIRTTKLALLRSRLRRHCSQARKAFKGNVGEHSSCKSVTQLLIDSARESSKPTVFAIKEKSHEPQAKIFRYKRRGLDKRQCLYKNDEEVQCTNPVVPCANHCTKHIMYNIDQQLFDYCTAKTVDNVQCCIPVIDLTHELPLCVKHAREVDENYKIEDEEIKPKRPRKKTKPSALTRPPKKGKKKKNQRKAAAQLQAQLENMEDTQENTESVNAVEEDMEHSGSATEESEHEGEDTPSLPSRDENKKPVSPIPVPVSIPQTKTVVPHPVPQPRPVELKLDHPKDLFGELPDSVLAANLPADLNLNKGLELPLEQASRLLEQEDFQDVLNKIPDETFDLFTGKNGDHEPTKEEMDELERHLAAANMDLSFAQQTLSSTNDYDEQVRILASLLTNQPTSNVGGDVANGAFDAHAQENINMIANSLASSSNQTVSTNYTPQQVSQFYPTQQMIPTQSQFQNAQTSVHQQHPGMGVNVTVANAGMVHSQHHSSNPVVRGNQQINTGHIGVLTQGRGQVRQMMPPTVRGGSPVTGHPQQIGSVNQVNQFINSHHGSPVHQIGSPVPRGVQSPGSPQTPNSVKPVRIPVPSTAVTINSQNSAKIVHQQMLQSNPNSVYSFNPGAASSSPVGTPPLVPGVSTSVLNQQAHQNLVNQLSNSVHQQFYPMKNQMEKLQPGIAVNKQGYPSNLIAGVGNQQQLNQLGNILHPKLFQQQAVSGNGQFCISSSGSVPSPIIPPALSNSHVTGSVQSITQNASSPYHTNVIAVQQSQEHAQNTNVHVGTKNIPPSNVMATSANSKLLGNSNLEAVPHMYQNGFPNSAQLLSDINSGKLTLAGNQATDPQLLQSLAQSLTSQHHPQSNPGINKQRIAQTGTGS